jgi:hypothetical protein
MPLKGKILFDLGHFEYRLDVLMEKLTKEDFLCDATTESLTESKLNQYTAIVLNLPNFKIKYDDNDECYKERCNIMNFVNKGGGIVVLQDYPDIFHEIVGSFYDEKLPIGVWPIYVSELRNERYYRNIDDKIKGCGSYDIIQSEIKIHNHPTTEGVESLYPKNKHGNVKTIMNPTTQLELTTILYHDLRFPINLSELQHYFTKQNEIPNLNFLEKRRIKNLCKKMLEGCNEQLDERYERVGSATYYGRGRGVGLALNFFDDTYIVLDEKKNSNLRLALNILEWLSQPTLHKLIEKPRKRLPFVYYP